MLWNPPLLDADLGLRGSTLADASRLLAELVTGGARTICFAKSRKAAELVHRFTVDRVDAATGRRLTPYRAGYTPAQRREIEQRLVAGDLLGVTATDALELGIDIGLLDCAISVGFPGTVASLRQQWGRAGRRDRGLAVLVASDDALDQFFMREPEALLGRRSKRRSSITRTRACSTRICGRQRSRARSPTPTRTRSAPRRWPAAALLDDLERTPAGLVWGGRDYPAARVSLRSGDTEAFTVVEATTGAVLGQVERERAWSTVHEGAVYLHLGRQYLVQALDQEARAAVVAEVEVDWYTQPRKESTTTIEEPLQVERTCGVDLHFGRIAVTEQVIAYQRKAIADGSTIETVPLDLPETTFETEAIWFSPGRPPPARDRRDAGAARRAPCRGALADRAAAALGDVRPVGHRRPLDERPSADRRADDLRLRRPCRRCRPHRARLRVLPRAGWRTRRGCSPAARAATAAPPACRARSAAT